MSYTKIKKLPSSDKIIATIPLSAKGIKALAEWLQHAHFIQE